MKRNRGLSTSLKIGLSGLFLATCIFIGMLVWVLLRFERQIVVLQKEDSMAIASSSLLSQGLQMGQATRNILLDPSNPTAYKNHEDAQKAFMELWAQMNLLAQSGASGDPRIASLKEIRDDIDKDVVLQKSVHKLAGDGRMEQAIKILNNDETPQWRKARALLREMRKQVEEKAATDRALADRMARSMHMIMGVMVLCTMSATLLVLFRTLKLLSKAQVYLSEAYLTSDQTAEASRELSSINLALAEGASEQAASIEETSSSIEEMSAMTRRNADNASQANQLMTRTSEVVSRVDRSMKELTASMDEISSASEETSKIIKTIDDIAFQTNLLALNAAVEAARAGQTGAGFAVVADEVRNLARKAAEAARNTTDLIESTLLKVREGSESLEKTAREFEEVSHSVEKTSELVGEISAASHEQAQGIDLANRAMSAMDKSVQQTAAGTEESASASQQMRTYAELMKNLVGNLNLLIAGGNGNTADRSTRMSETKRHESQSPVSLSRITAIPHKTLNAGNGKSNYFNPERSQAYAERP